MTLELAHTPRFEVKAMTKTERGPELASLSRLYFYTLRSSALVANGVGSSPSVFETRPFFAQ